MKTVRNLLLLLAATLVTACERGQRTSTDELGDDLSDARVCYERALEAFDGDSIRLGEQLLNRAIRLATASDDLHTLYLAQSRLAESLAWGNSEAALEMAKQALATYELRPDDERNHIILLDYIGTYASQLAFNTDGSFDEALDYTNRAYQLALASKDSLGTEQLCQTLTSLSNIHWAMEEYTTALGFARQAVACADDGQLLGVQQVLARCLVSCDSLAEAEEVYRQMQPGTDLQAAYIVQSNLAKLALHRSDIAAAEEAIDSAFSHAEDLYYKALQQKDEYYQTAFQQELDNEQLRYRTALQRRTLWSGIIIILLLTGATAYIIRQRLRANRHKLAIQQQQLQLHEQEAAAQREQLRQRDGIIDFLQDFILQRSEVIQKLGASSERHIALTPREWKEVERTLNAIDGDRIVRLRQRFPDLREEDLQLCILTRLRLTNRAIGNIYGVSISAVQHRKLKLKKETFGEDNPDIPFEQVLDRL
jgi:hypothetical protein